VVVENAETSVDLVFADVVAPAGHEREANGGLSVGRVVKELEHLWARLIVSPDSHLHGTLTGSVDDVMLAVHGVGDDGLAVRELATGDGLVDLAKIPDGVLIFRLFVEAGGEYDVITNEDTLLSFATFMSGALVHDFTVGPDIKDRHVATLIVDGEQVSFRVPLNGGGLLLVHQRAEDSLLSVDIPGANRVVTGH